jgi:UPF0755 protein
MNSKKNSGLGAALFLFLGCITILGSGVYYITKPTGVPALDEHGDTTRPTSTSTIPTTPITSTSTKPMATSTKLSPSVPATTTEVLPEGTERFVVPLSSTTTDQVIDSLYDQGFIMNKTIFSLTFISTGRGAIVPGAYKLSKDMNSRQLSSILRKAPYMKWIVIPPGIRKEEIAELLAKALDWSITTKNKWVSLYTATKYDYIEGTYFPDTYLVPVAEAPLDIANRLTAHFNEKFSDYLTEFNAQNIKWTTGLTFASILQREAANVDDMPLIAGILWNRLHEGMPLQVDSTLQYVRGNKGAGWWAPITVADKQTDSPYNTYKNKGLPPHPIANPGIAAIIATLNPTETKCLYYLHDKDRMIHCAVTYEEHQANIEKYLK